MALLFFLIFVGFSNKNTNQKTYKMKKSLSLLSMLFALITFAQKEISGNVKDTNGNPLIGVNILEKGTTNGTVTDFDGQFKLIVKESAILEISFIGYEKQEVGIQNSNFLNIIFSNFTFILSFRIITIYFYNFICIYFY